MDMKGLTNDPNSEVEVRIRRRSGTLSEVDVKPAEGKTSPSVQVPYLRIVELDDPERNS